MRKNFVRVSLATALLSMSFFSAHAANMTISGTPIAIIAAGAKYYFRPTVANAIAGRLVFCYINRPGWSNNYRSSGAIIGVPTTPGVYKNIQICAGDGVHFAMTAPFTITVTGASTAPAVAQLKISGTPEATARVGEFYSFTPTVVAPAGSSLTYTAYNKPAWIQFNKSTGSLSGTPAASDVATDHDVVISVSNGAQTAVLSGFDILVDPPVFVAASSANLSWSKPSVNTNGSPLTNLAGYVVRYGTNMQALSKQISVASANTTGIEIQNLTAGNWYFEVAAVSSARVQSEFSAASRKTIE